NTVAWERSEAIAEALDAVLAGADRAARLETLRRMLREKVPARTATLGRWLREERQAERVAVVLAALGERPADEGRPHLEAVVRDRKHAEANRLLAVSLFVQGLDGTSGDRLLAVAEAVEDGPVLAELLRAVGGRRPARAAPLLLNKAASEAADVRARAVEALA